MTVTELYPPAIPTDAAPRNATMFPSLPVHRRRRLLWYSPHPAVRAQLNHPIERLGRWTGLRFVPVRPGSVTSRNVHVMSHGWAPGLAPTLRRHDEFLRVWDDAAVRGDGARFDGWYGPLADEILASDPDAAVLGFSWLDLSATELGLLRGAQSQAFTDAAAQAMALGLTLALGGDEHRVHLIGFSHGSKVAAVAGLLLDQPPAHLTLLDSPEGLLPVIGGALNDLSPYLRFYDIGVEPGQTFVDSYPSAYGVHYASRKGLGSVVEVALDPEGYPLPDAGGAHSYAHVWYRASRTHGAGLAWSPLLEGDQPGHTQLRQFDHDRPWALELNRTVSPAPRLTATLERVTEQRSSSYVLRSDGPRTFRTVRWLRPGDVAATTRIRWLSGPPEAQISLIVRGRERWRTRRGWTDNPVRPAVIPLGGLRPGPVVSRVKLISPEPAEVEIQRAAIGGIPMSARTALQQWIQPGVAALARPLRVVTGRAVWQLVASIGRCADVVATKLPVFAQRSQTTT